MEKFHQEELFFGWNLPLIDLKKIKDVMDFEKPCLSFLELLADVLPNGCESMFNLMLSAEHSKQLIDELGRLSQM